MTHFDHIIMNPPYSGNLHLKILREAMQHSDDIVSLEPHLWLTDPLVDYASYCVTFDKMRKSVKNRLESVELVEKDDFNRLFKTAGEFGVGIFHFIKNSNFDINQYKNKDPLVNKIMKQVVAMKSLRSQFTRRCDDPLFVPVRRRTHHNLKWISDECNAKDGIQFKTKLEMDNFIKSLDLWIYKLLNQFSLGENSAQVPWLGDYTKEWTNEQLYNLFDLTKEEVDLVEKEII